MKTLTIIFNSAADYKKNDTTQPKLALLTQTRLKHQNSKATRAEKCTKLVRNGSDGANAAIDPRKRKRDFVIPTNKISEQPVPTTSSQAKKLKAPRLRFGETVDGRAYTIEDPPNRYEEDFMTECYEEPTQDWQRRWNIGMTLRHNARHPEDPTPLLPWIKQSPDNYATLKRPLPESETDRTYVYDTDYRCDPWDEPTIYDTNKLCTVSVYKFIYIYNILVLYLC